MSELNIMPPWVTGSEFHEILTGMDNQGPPLYKIVET